MIQDMLNVDDLKNRTLYWLGKCVQKGCRPSIERRPTAAPGTVQTYPHLKDNGLAWPIASSGATTVRCSVGGVWRLAVTDTDSAYSSCPVQASRRNAQRSR
jgi:hypothetical protein